VFRAKSSTYSHEGEARFKRWAYSTFLSTIVDQSLKKFPSNYFLRTTMTIWIIKIIQRRSSGANFIMEVLTTEPYLYNPELNRSKFINMFTKQCLQSVCNVTSIGSLIQEKFDSHFLTILYPERTLNGF
jgi:hypothetical protein